MLEPRLWGPWESRRFLFRARAFPGDPGIYRSGFQR